MRLKDILPFLTITIYLICLFISFGCQKASSSLSSSWQFFSGRDDAQSLERPPLYRALVPSHWIRKDPSPTESIVDTTKANCEFYIHEAPHSIRLTLHTFPITQGSMRIPAQAQIARWKNQFEELDLVVTHILPDSHGGFSGLFFEGQGILQGNPTKVMGWSMQLSSVYVHKLNQETQEAYCNKCSDYTIKVSGPPDLMEKHKTDILAFAHSFELIDELPSPL